MKKKIFPQLFYLNNFNFCSRNIYLEGRLNNYIQKVLYTDDDFYMYYLNDLKAEYSFNNYMYILESIINYIIKIYKLTYYDYISNTNSTTYETLCNIENRYKNILSIYDESFDRSNYKIKKYNKKTRKFNS